jgi:hypothetical protein
MLLLGVHRHGVAGLAKIATDPELRLSKLIDHVNKPTPSEVSSRIEALLKSLRPEAYAALRKRSGPKKKSKDTTASETSPGQTTDTQAPDVEMDGEEDEGELDEDNEEDDGADVDYENSVAIEHPHPSRPGAASTPSSNSSTPVPPAIVDPMPGPFPHHIVLSVKAACQGLHQLMGPLRAELQAMPDCPEKIEKWRKYLFYLGREVDKIDRSVPDSPERQITSTCLWSYAATEWTSRPDGLREMYYRLVNEMMQHQAYIQHQQQLMQQQLQHQQQEPTQDVEPSNDQPASEPVELAPAVDDAMDVDVAPAQGLELSQPDESNQRDVAVEPPGVRVEEVEQTPIQEAEQVLEAVPEISEVEPQLPSEPELPEQIEQQHEQQLSEPTEQQPEVEQQPEQPDQVELPEQPEQPEQPGQHEQLEHVTTEQQAPPLQSEQPEPELEEPKPIVETELISQPTPAVVDDTQVSTDIVEGEIPEELIATAAL